MRIALLEDDEPQAHVMQVWLETVDHECRTFALGADFMEGIVGDHFDLLILDWILPDTSGLDVLEFVRKTIDWPIPVIFVTQRDREEDIVLALETGADDYMVKPVKPLEMLARITALGRRVLQKEDIPSDIFEFGDYRFSSSSRTVEISNKPVDLTHKEFELSLYLFRNVGQLLSRSNIMVQVWDCAAELNTRTVDTHISRIRNKLGLVPENGWRLNAVYQHGYRLERLEKTNLQAAQ